MPTVSEITADIKNTFGSAFVNQKQAGDYLGMAKDKRREFLANLPQYKTGKEIKYHAIDIARHLDKIKTHCPYG